MPGIFGGYNIGDYKFQESNLKQDLIASGDFLLGRNYIDKFNQERFTIETDDYICIFEGFLFDLEGCTTQREYFEKNISETNIESFIEGLDGTFSIVVFFKINKTLYLIVDHLASFKIFYSVGAGRIIFSSDLFDVTRYFNKIGETCALDTDSVFFFLGFGSVATDKTLFDNVKKLEPGTYLKFTELNCNVEVVRYHELKFEVDNTISLSAAVDGYEKILADSMDRIVNLNSKYGLENIAGLSGGLDSKSMVCMMNERVGSNMGTFTFSEYGSADQRIAQKVSSNLKIPHVFISLDNGLCLTKNILDVVRNSNGMISIHTLLHGYNSFININTNNSGLLLTGQIGDAIFGSHFIGSKSVKEYITSKSHYGQVPEYIFEKIGYSQSLIDAYSSGNSEAYIYEGRISNGTMYGDIVNRGSVDTLTPFYSKKLLDFTLTVPEKYRCDELAYMAWLKKNHPQVLQFDWDKSDCRPTSQRKVKVFKFIKTVRNALKKRLKLKYDGMNPFDVWFRENPAILKNIDKLFHENINVLDSNVELQQAASKLYYSNIDRYQRHKFTVVTLLLSLKLHFGEI